jgi:hypothetical protein
MVGLIPFLRTAKIGIEANDMKVHLACWNGREHPIDEYYAGRFEEWQQWQTRRNFECAQVLSLVDLGVSN